MKQSVLKRNLIAAVVLLMSALALEACSASVQFPPSPFASLQRLLTSVPAYAPAALPAARAPVATPGPASAASLAEMQGALEQIYNAVSPSVVTIQVEQRQAVQNPTLPQFPGFPFFGFPSQSGEPQYQYQQALGSGFVWDSLGHIVTNNHVVAGANQISITFPDVTIVPGSVVGHDADSDLAVVKVSAAAAELRPVQMGDSSQLKVGQLAIAIGNPFGEQNTMTTGIISAVGRSLPVSAETTSTGPTYTIPDVIQTDAPINPGNSGGVLLNDQGQVVGVTSSIESPVQASSGIGFAIPAEIVDKVVPALVSTGHYDHPWLGLSGSSLDPALSQAMNLNAGLRGALVVDVTPNSPADKAGLQGSTRQVTIDGSTVRVGGDVITAIDGESIKTFDDLVAYLARSTQVGQTVKLTVLRDGKPVSIDVTLAARPGSATAQGGQSASANGNAWLGVEGTSLTPQIAKAMSLDSSQPGVLVEQVDAGSPADKAGLRGSFRTTTIGGNTVRIGGDVIVAVDGQVLTTTQELQQDVAQDSPGQSMALTVLRDGKQMDLRVQLGVSPTTTP